MLKYEFYAFSLIHQKDTPVRAMRHTGIWCYYCYYVRIGGSLQLTVLCCWETARMRNRDGEKETFIIHNLDVNVS